MGNEIMTYKGHLVDPFNYKTEFVNIKDIARALSMTCRFGGHVDKFYSVAEHSVYVSKFVGNDVNTQLWALLHDASEAYVGDVPKPIKHHFKEIDQAEDSIMKCIASRFNLTDDKIPDIVHQVDKNIVFYEAIQLKKKYKDSKEWKYFDTGIIPVFNYKIGMNPKKAETIFLARFNELYNTSSQKR
jgi:5'-deoxynucleotidase YfbR-like HD superfamily hydrolase